MLRQKRIVFLLKDGRQGLQEHGPYDVIHLGGAIESVPQSILSQLKPGGIIWAPVGGRDSQNITVFTKSAENQEEIKEEKIMDVRYGSLTTPED